MRKQMGNWLMDTKANTLSYENGRLWRIFTIPPSADLKPDDIVDWIARRDEESWLEESDIQDLIMALDELLGRGGLRGAAPLSH